VEIPRIKILGFKLGFLPFQRFPNFLRIKIEGERLWPGGDDPINPVMQNPYLNFTSTIVKEPRGKATFPTTPLHLCLSELAKRAAARSL
jgi:hypothetical protein